MTDRNRSLRSTLFRVVIIPIVTVLVILFGVILLAASLMLHEITTRQELIIEALALQGEQYLNETGRLMRSLAYGTTGFSPDEQAELLSQTRANYPRYSAIYLLDEKGQVLVEDTDSFTLLGLDLSRERFFNRARDSGEIFFSDPFISLTTGQVAVTGAVPIFEEGKFQGMLVGELNLALLQETIEQVEAGESGVTFIVDQSGALVAHPNQVWVQERRNLGDFPLVGEGLAGQKAFEFFFDENQNAWLIGSVSPMAWDWVVVATQPAFMVARPLITLLIVSGLAFGLSLALFLLAQVYIVRRLTDPISTLAERADAISRGQYEDMPSEQVGGFREINTLNNSFSRMVTAVNTRRAELVAANEALNNELQERIRAEEALRESEERFRQFFENELEYCYMVSPDGIVIDVNRAALETLGYQKNELVGEHFSIVYTPESHPKMERLFVKWKRAGYLRDEELDIITKEGQRRTVLLSAGIVQDRGGNILHSVSVQRDITERKRAEEALRESEERYHNLFDNVPVGLFRTAPDGQLLDANLAFVEIFGYPDRETVLNTNATDMYVDPENRQRWQEIVDQEGVIRGSEEQLKMYDGTPIWTESNIRAIRGPDDLVGIYEGSVEDITERKHAEQALQESERRFRQLSQAAFEGIAITDQGKVLDANDQCAEMFGYTRSELIGAPVVNLVAPESRELVAQNIQSGYEKPYEHLALKKDGTVIPVEVQARAIEYSGRSARVSAIKDITERKEAQAALLGFAEKIRAMYETLTDGITFSDLQGNIVEVNMATVHIHGFLNEEELIGKNALELIAERDRERAITNLQKTLEEGRSGVLEYKLLKKDGIEFDGELSAVLLRDEQGEPSGFVAITRDITERKRAEKEIQNHFTRLEAIREIELSILAAQSPEDTAMAALERIQALLPYNLGGVVLYDFDANQVEFLVTYPTGEVIDPLTTRSYTIDEFTPYVETLRTGQIYIMPDLAAETDLYLASELLKEAGIRSFIDVPLIVRGDLIGSFSVLSDQPNAFEPVHLDIAREVANALAVSIQQGRLLETEQRRREELETAELERIRVENEIRQLNEELEARVRARTAELVAVNQELEAFSYSVSHDLRAPLRRIDGFSQVLVEDYETQLDEQGQHFLNRIRNATQLMGELIDDLLKLSRVTRQEMQREQVDLSVIAQDILSKLHQEEPQRQAQFEVSKRLVASGDERLLRVVLENLLDNAWKFTSKKDRTRIEFGASETEDHVKVYYVRDNGAGFDMDYAAKLFGAFQRLHTTAEYPGTGIGLATVQRIIHRHGGHIWAEGAVNQGATISFTLG